ncbi:MAG: hypothetical protein ACO4CG_05745 [Prochlorothrix sp.]
MSSPLHNLRLQVAQKLLWLSHSIHQPDQAGTKEVPPDQALDLEQGAAPVLEQDNPSVLEASQPSNTGSYPERTDRIRAITDCIKVLSPLLWVGVVLVIVIQIWGQFALSELAYRLPLSLVPQSIEVKIPPSVQPHLTADLNQSLDQALNRAVQSASDNLDQWEETVRDRIETNFLDWYYNYFVQLKTGLSAIWINLTSPSEEQKAERLIQGFQTEFTRRVLQPELMQLSMERFTREAIEIYVEEISHGLSDIQGRYHVPQPTWDRFLTGLGTVTYSVGGQQQDLSLQTLERGGVYLAGVTLVQAVKIVGFQKLGAKIASKAASKTAANLATKTAGKVLAKGGGMTAGIVGLNLLDPIAAVGVLAWDIWDHHHTVQVERPILQHNLEHSVPDKTLETPTIQGFQTIRLKCLPCKGLGPF